MYIRSKGAEGSESTLKTHEEGCSQAESSLFILGSKGGLHWLSSTVVSSSESIVVGQSHRSGRSLVVNVDGGGSGSGLLVGLLSTQCPDTGVVGEVTKILVSHTGRGVDGDRDKYHSSGAVSFSSSVVKSSSERSRCS